jgi:hypothetical protein
LIFYYLRKYETLFTFEANLLKGDINMTSMPQNSDISISSIIIAEKDPVTSEMADEVAILEPKSGMYFGLDHVGARIWELIQEPIAVKDIRNTILSEYDVDVERCERDLFVLFREMSNKGLIEVRDTIDV